MNSFIKTHTLSIILIAFIISILFALTTPYLVNHYVSSYGFNTIKSNEIGDSIGGVLGPAVAIIASILTFLAFWVQYDANKKQNEYIRKQRFEDTFFRLLENHQNIVSSIDFIESNFYGTVKEASNRDSFKEIFSGFETNYKEDIKKKPNEDVLETEYESMLRNYDYIQHRYKSDLHHYFRFIYRFLKFIKEADIDEADKYKYSSIYRAVFSAYELPMLLYNGLHPPTNGKQEKFSVFSNESARGGEISINSYLRLLLGSRSDGFNNLMDT
jgi:hypothetical protein